MGEAGAGGVGVRRVKDEHEPPSCGLQPGVFQDNFAALSWPLQVRALAAVRGTHGTSTLPQNQHKGVCKALVLGRHNADYF